MARDPLVITRMKRLEELDLYVSVGYQSYEDKKYFSVYSPNTTDPANPHSHTLHNSYPETYQDLLIDLANRIIQAEAANGK